MTYAEKLKHPKWQKKRLEILNRDNFMCRCCGNTELTLHVHHFTYLKGRQPWDYENSNFITMCEDCHSEEEFFVKNAHQGFVTLNRVFLFPIRKMWQVSFALAFLSQYDKESYAEFINVLNGMIDKNQSQYNVVWDSCQNITKDGGLD